MKDQPILPAINPSSNKLKVFVFDVFNDQLTRKKTITPDILITHTRQKQMTIKLRDSVF